MSNTLKFSCRFATERGGLPSELCHSNNLGKTNLTDAAWQSPTNSAHRFFKVKVALP